MFNARFIDSLTDEQKENLSDMINTLSKNTAKGDLGSYEFISRQRAIMSRSILNDLEFDQRVALRFYGKYGLWLNTYMRAGFLDPNIPGSVTRTGMQQFMTQFNIRTLDDVNRIPIHSIGTEFGRSLTYPTHIRNTIDRVISTNSDRFSRSGHVFRVARAKRTAYISEGEATDLSKLIRTGDIIRDPAFWSTASNYSAALFRYSYTGMDATHTGAAHRTVAADEEEIMYVIEHNEHLRAIDISGFKAERTEEQWTSGELLVHSNSSFRVIGIENTERRMLRRTVILRPEAEASILPTDTIRNPYSGERIPIPPPP